MRLVQFELNNGERRVGVVDAGQVREVQGAASVRDLALAAIEAAIDLAQQVQAQGLGETHDYQTLLSEMRILPPLDHPDPAHMLISGTGLTHLGSASARDKMHQQAGDEATLTDTMRIFKWGVEGGKPAAGQAGVQPEWFYKGGNGYRRRRMAGAASVRLAAHFGHQKCRTDTGPAGDNAPGAG